MIYRCLHSGEDDVSSKSRMRGKYPRNTDRKNAVKAHISLYNPTISHYRREHSPNRLYLATDITEKKMYQEYLEAHPELKVSYTFFCRVVKELNISIVKLGHEVCETCVAATQHKNLMDHKTEDEGHDCSVCAKHKEHMRLAKESRAEYRADGDSVETDEIVLAVDLQKIIQLPRLEGFKTIVFSQRILAFNETFAPVGGYAKSNAVLACLWHEAVAGRSANDIISCFHQVINHLASLLA